MIKWNKKKYNYTKIEDFSKSSGPRELTRYQEQHPFAVFAIIEVEPGKYAATTRAKDRGEEGKVGLPGGKVDPGEKGEEAVIREAAEEGGKLWLKCIDKENYFLCLIKY